MTESNETTAERAIREALESVERIEREGHRSRRSEQAGQAGAEQTGVEDVEVLGPETPADAPTKKSASESLLEATMKAKAELQDVLTQTQKEAKDLFDRLARVSADFDNFKKRVNREKADAIKFGNEGLLKDMLPVHDNLQRALQATSGEGSSESNVLEGIKLVAKQFEDALGKFGVVGFSAHGQLFDPARHEAVGARPDDDMPVHHVAEEYQRGYMLHDRLLRPALVIVSAGPPATEN